MFAFALYNIQLMGSTPSALSPSDFSKKWQISHTADNLTIWQNKADPSQHLQQYYIPNYNQDKTKKLYKIRNDSKFLVNGYSLKEDGFACCGDHEANKVLIERIPLRLSNIEDIPYPDLLHLFDTCIRGFPQLSEVVGFFNVDEDQIGVNEKGQVKVWLNTAFESTDIQGNKNVTEADMVADIFEIFAQTTDHQSYPEHVPNLMQFLGQPTGNSTFAEVQNKFQNYTKLFTASYVPNYLQCVHSVGGPIQINSWCRNNQSFGFDQQTMRASERVFIQSKLANQGQPQTVQIDGRETTQIQQNVPVAGPVPQQIQQQQFVQQQLVQGTILSEQQRQAIQREEQARRRFQEEEEARRRNQQQIQQVPVQRNVQFVEGPQQTFFYSLQQSNTQPNSNVQPPAQVNQPQPQQIVQIQSQVQSQIQYQSQVQNRPQLQPQPQVQPQSQVQYYPRPQLQLQPQPQRQFLQGTPLINSQPIIQYEQQRFETVAQPFPQAESRLQQQRVISQAIQVKEDSRVKSIANQASPVSYNQSVNAINSNLSQSNTQQPEKIETTVQDNLYNYGRAVPFSVNVNEDRYVPPTSTEDGKSSADFLALLNELKKPSGQSTFNQVQASPNSSYSQIADTPASNFKEESAQSSRNKIFNYPNAHETFSQEAYSNYGQESNRLIEEGGKIFGVRSEVEPQEDYKFGQYNFSKYERSIDPDIQADLLRYQ